MNGTRIWVVGGLVVILVILGLGVLVGVKPQLDAAAALEADRANVEVVNAQHDATLRSLKEQFVRVDEIRSEVAVLRDAVPAQADLDSFTGELAALQSQYGVVIGSYTPGDPAMFVPAVELAEAVPPSVNGTNFVTIPISLSVTGEREATLAFVDALQKGSRLVHVSNLSVAASAEGSTTVSITALVYALLDTPIVDPAAVVPAPTEAVAAE
jgi:Tfp pilus assembly protein PilO